MKCILIILTIAMSTFSSTYLSVSNHYFNFGKIMNKVDIGIGLGYSLDFQSIEGQYNNGTTSEDKSYLFTLEPDISIRYYLYKNPTLNLNLNSISSIELPVLKQGYSTQYSLSEILSLGSEYFIYNKVSLGLAIGPRLYDTKSNIGSNSSQYYLQVFASYDVQLRYYF
jgi:hypothetical protein